MFTRDPKASLAIGCEREAICSRLHDSWGLREAVLPQARSYVSLDQVDEALGAYERAENPSRLDGPDADQAAHVLHATLEEVKCGVKELLRQRRTHRETPRLSVMETRVGRELKALKEKVEAIPDRGWVRRRWGVRGRLTPDVDPSELTLRW